MLDIKNTGFRSVREAREFSKMYALLCIYQGGQIDCDTNGGGMKCAVLDAEFINLK